MKPFMFIALLLCFLVPGPARSAPLQGVERLFAADYHVCARQVSGASVCWGLNYTGELGHGTTVSSASPVALVGLGGVAEKIDGGAGFSCAVTTSGSAKCWGSNGYGELGLGSPSFTPSLTPMTVIGLGSGVTAVATGQYHACALLVGGGVKCWGNGDSGRLGNGATAAQPSPVDVSGLTSGVASIAASNDFTCARMLTGTIKCWGDNAFDKLGSSGFVSSSIPVDVPSITGATAIALGSHHACALSGAGRLRCWGGNFVGQLGDGTLTNRPNAMNVTGFASGVASVSTGGSHSCALTAMGSVSCWGQNLSGQLGNPDNTIFTTPVAVAGLSSGVSEISLGFNFSCARANDATVRCWGANGTGSLGDGQFSSRVTPASVLGLGSASTLTAGDSHTCAVASGVLRCWGMNRHGELGTGNTISVVEPTPVSSVAASVTAAVTGYNFTCALTTAGAVLCWGNNQFGQLGDGTTTDRLFAAPVSGLDSGVTAIAAGTSHVCALASGAVKCWGRNVTGQLGDGNFNGYTASPVNTLGLPAGITRIVAGDGHTCALTAGGGAKCWGDNSFGQLGTGAPPNLAVPGDVFGLTSGVADIVAGAVHTCATTTSGAMRCWGRGAQGRLGTGNLDGQPTPANVVGMSSGVTSIAAGGLHTCAVRNGAVRCWGGNNQGGLGDGTQDSRMLPIPVIGLASGMASVYAGDRHSCARAVSGLVTCWGDDGSGQVGDGGRAPDQPTHVIDGDRLFASGFDPGM